MIQCHQRNPHLVRRQSGAETKMRLKHGALRIMCNFEETITDLDQLEVLQNKCGNQDVSRMHMAGGEEREALRG
jgi:hypothetical protein